jgi:hypothetical protein
MEQDQATVKLQYHWIMLVQLYVIILICYILFHRVNPDIAAVIVKFYVMLPSKTREIQMEKMKMYNPNDFTESLWLLVSTFLMVLVFVRAYRYFFNNLMLTKDKLIIRDLTIREVNLKEVTDVTVYQSALGKKLNYGNLYLYQGSACVPVRCIKDPVDIQNAILNRIKHSE